MIKKSFKILAVTATLLFAASNANAYYRYSASGQGANGCHFSVTVVLNVDGGGSADWSGDCFGTAGHYTWKVVDVAPPVNTVDELIQVYSITGDIQGHEDVLWQIYLDGGFDVNNYTEQ